MLGIMVSKTSSKAVVDDNGNLSIVEEFTVTTVNKGGAAEGKLSVGDVFISAAVNGGTMKVFTRRHQLTDVLLSVRKGDTVTLVIRNSSGNEETVTIAFDKNAYFTEYA